MLQGACRSLIYFLLIKYITVLDNELSLSIKLKYILF